MKNDYSEELSPEVREKMKKNLVYVGIFSVIMLFAGFTSAYIVSMGDSFWLKFKLPNAFWISTTLIILSSVFFVIGIWFAKKNQLGKLKLFISLTLLAGIAFVYFQFKGYGQLIDMGAHAVNNHIIVTEGRYGDYYQIKFNGNFIDVDGNKYFVEGREMTDGEMKQLQDFMKQFEKIDRHKDPKVTSYGDKFILYYNNLPIGLIDGKLITSEGDKLQYTDFLRLSQLAVNVRDKRGDFFVKGEYGKDFSIFYKGKELEYVGRELRLNGKKLDKFLQMKAMDTADTATSYLYLITVTHLLHILIAMIYLMKLVIRSFTGEFNAENNLSLRVGSIFWHFLGLLWIYLLLFLLFIH